MVKKIKKHERLKAVAGIDQKDQKQVDEKAAVKAIHKAMFGKGKQRRRKK